MLFIFDLKKIFFEIHKQTKTKKIMSLDFHYNACFRDDGVIVPIIKLKVLMESKVVPQSEKLVMLKAGMKWLCVQMWPYLEMSEKLLNTLQKEKLEVMRKIYSKLEIMLKEMTQDPLDLMISPFSDDLIFYISYSFEWDFDGYED